MKLVIRQHPSLGHATMIELRRRIYSGLAKVSPWVRALELSVIVDPDGNVCCRLELSGRSLPAVILEHAGRDPLACVDALVVRAAKRVVRQLSQRRLLETALAL
jgi:hypothetical protein